MNKIIVILLLLFINYPYLYSMETYIYALIHPVTKEIKYIGKSDTPQIRLSQHIIDSRKKGRKNKKEAWIKSLLNKNLKPEFIILETVSKKDWKIKEREWIAKYKDQLKNQTNGGDGIDGYKHTPESLKKMKPSWIKKGQRLSPKTEFQKGHIKTKEWKEIISKKLKGYKHSEKTKRNMSIAQKKMSKKKSEYMMGNQHAKGAKWSEERKKEFIKNRKGHFVSQETRNKIKAKVSKPIFQYDKQGNFIQEWESAKYAAKILNIGYKAINNNLNNLSITSEGFVWKYKT